MSIETAVKAAGTGGPFCGFAPWAFFAPGAGFWGTAIVTRLGASVLLAVLLAAPLGACSRNGPAPDVSFLPTAAVEGDDKKAAFDAAKEVCVEEAQRKGISSVTRILLLRGKTSKSDYVECMEAKGFAEVD